MNVWLFGLDAHSLEKSTEEINSGEVWQFPWWHLRQHWGQERLQWRGLRGWPTGAKCAGKPAWAQPRGDSSQGSQIPWPCPFLSMGIWVCLGICFLALACLLSSLCTHPRGHGPLPGFSVGSHLAIPADGNPRTSWRLFLQVHCRVCNSGGCQGHLAFHLC